MNMKSTGTHALIICQIKEWNDRLKDLSGSYIADILCARNTLIGEWVLDAPIIIRLEACDIAVVPSRDGKPLLCFGDIDTDAPYPQSGIPSSPAENLHGASAGSEGGPVAQWESYRPLSRMMGAKAERLTVHPGECASSIALEILAGEDECLRVLASKSACAIRTVRRNRQIEDSRFLALTIGGTTERPKGASPWSPPVRFHDPSEVVPILAS